MPVVKGHRTGSFASTNPRNGVPELQSHASQLNLGTHNGPNKGLALPDPSSTGKRPGFPYLSSSHFQDHSSAISVAPSDSSGVSNLAPITPDEPGRHPADSRMKGLEWQQAFGPPVIHPITTSFGPPTTLSTSMERMPDVHHDLAQRILPLPAPSTPRDMRSQFRGLLNPPILQPPESHARDYKMSSENPESDAAKALAGLASRGR